MPRDIFISYTNDDKSIADDLCHALEAGGLTCWIAPRNIPPGSSWTMGIMNAISECQTMVLVFSAKSNESVHVLREVLQAVEKGRPIFPFRIENTFPAGGLAYCLLGVQWLDATTRPLTGHFAALVEQMRALHESPAAPAASGSAPAPAAAAPSSRASDIHIECSQCAQAMVFDASAAGQPARCQNCRAAFTIARPRGEVSTPPPAPVEEAMQRLLSPEIATPAVVAKIGECLTSIVGPIGPLIVKKALTHSASLDALRTELLTCIPDFKDQGTFLRSCGDALPPPPVECIPLPPMAPSSLVPAGPCGDLNPAIVAELKTVFATFVGPLAKVLVDRAIRRTGSVPELLQSLAAELGTPGEQERFLRALPASLRKAG